MILKKTKRPKTLVIGLDGFGVSVLDILINRYSDTIKNILTLKQKGSYSPLQSVLPTVTPCAWSSFITGVTPAKHNIYDFTHNTELTNALSIKAKTIWSILRENGIKVGALHIPMTYPPEEVNGFIIPGQFAPSFSEKSIYPSSLYKKFKKFFNRYKAFYNSREYAHNEYGPTDIDGFIEKLTEIVKNKTKLNLMLMDKYPDLDIFITVFFETDTIQHYLWKYLDESYPLADRKESKRYKSKILYFFRTLDECIEQIIEKFGKDNMIFIISDHGLEPFIRHFHTNIWLMKQGLLHFEKAEGLKEKCLTRLAILIERLIPYASKNDPLAIYQPFIWKLIRKLKNIRIDYSLTKAFAYCENGIRINLRGREPQGIVNPSGEFERLRQSIIRDLLNLRDEQTGRFVIKRAITAEEIFSGPYFENAPDIIFIPSVGYWSDRLFPFALDIDNTRYKTAQHSLDGILIASGRGIKAGVNIQDARLVDILPTILFILGISLPEDIDGRPLIQMFEGEFLKLQDVKYKILNRNLQQKPVVEVYEKREAEIIKRRLRGLGYIT